MVILVMSLYFQTFLQYTVIVTKRDDGQSYKNKPQVVMNQMLLLWLLWFPKSSINRFLLTFLLHEGTRTG